MWEAFEGFNGGLSIGSRKHFDKIYAEYIVLINISENELLEMVFWLHGASRRYKLLINKEQYIMSMFIHQTREAELKSKMSQIQNEKKSKQKQKKCTQIYKT